MMKNNLSVINDDITNNNLYLFFELDKKLYALPSEQILEIIKLPLLEYPEKMPQGVIGLLNYNHLTFPTIDLRSFLNLELKNYNTENLLLIVKTEEVIFAIIVDKVVDVISIEQNQIQLPPYSSEDNLIKFFFHHDDSVVSVIDLHSVEESLKIVNSEAGTSDISALFPTDKTSLAILGERSQNLAKQRSYDINTFYSANQFITFSLNENKYCLDLKHIKEIVKLKNLTLTSIPCSPSYISGIINLRGDFITVLNMKDFLGLDNKSTTESTKIIVLESKNFKLAILVDEIFSISNIAEEQLNIKTDLASKLSINSKYIRAEFVRGKEFYTILNFDKIMQDEKLFIEDLF